MTCSAIVSIPKALVFAAGAFPRSPHGPDNGAERKSPHRTADHSYYDAQGYITAPPQHAHTHEHRHHEKHHRGQHHGAREPCAHPSPQRLRTSLRCARPSSLQSGFLSDRSAAMSLVYSYYSWAKASRNFCSCSSGRLVEMISKLYCLSSSITLSGAVAPLVRANSAEVPGVTFSRTCLMKSSSIPTSAIEPVSAPIPAPIAAPRNGTKKISPNRKPQKAPLIAPTPAMLCKSRVLGFLLPWGQLTTAASWRVIICRSCRPCRAMRTLSAPPGSLNFSTDSVAIRYYLLPVRLYVCDASREPVFEGGALPRTPTGGICRTTLPRRS